LNKENINSDSHHVTSDEVDHAAIKRKKYIKWGIIGALIIIALILVITLPIVLTKKDDNPSPGPAPGPTPGPPGGDKYNPYNVDPEKIVYDQVSLSGVLEVPSDLQ
jgi:cell division septation protein DedD